MRQRHGHWNGGTLCMRQRQGHWNGGNLCMRQRHGHLGVFEAGQMAALKNVHGCKNYSAMCIN